MAEERDHQNETTRTRSFRFACIVSHSEHGIKGLWPSIGREVELFQKLRKANPSVILPGVRGGDIVSYREKWSAVYMELADMHFRPNAAVNDRGDLLLHFCGHGEGGTLLFADDAGFARAANPAVLAPQIAKCRPACVVLNACFCADLARALHDACVAEEPARPPVIVYWEAEVNTTLCEKFAEQLYGTLVRYRRRDADPTEHTFGDVMREAFDTAQAFIAGELKHEGGGGSSESANQVKLYSAVENATCSSNGDDEYGSARATAAANLAASRQDPAALEAPPAAFGPRDTIPVRNVQTRGFKDYQGAYAVPLDSSGAPACPGKDTADQVRKHFKRVFGKSDNGDEMTPAKLDGGPLVKGQYRCLGSYYFECRAGPSRAYYFECWSHCSEEKDYALLHVHYETKPGLNDGGKPTHVNFRRCWVVDSARIRAIRGDDNQQYDPPAGMVNQDDQSAWRDWITKFKGDSADAEEHYQNYMKVWSGVPSINPTMQYFCPPPDQTTDRLLPGSGLWMEFTGFPLTGGRNKDNFKMAPWSFSDAEAVCSFRYPKQMKNKGKLGLIVTVSFANKEYPDIKTTETRKGNFPQVYAELLSELFRAPPISDSDGKKTKQRVKEIAGIADSKKTKQRVKEIAGQCRTRYLRALNSLTPPEGEETVTQEHNFEFELDDKTYGNLRFECTAHDVKWHEPPPSVAAVADEDKDKDALAKVLRHGEEFRVQEVDARRSDPSTGLNRSSSSPDRYVAMKQWSEQWGDNVASDIDEQNEDIAEEGASGCDWPSHEAALVRETDEAECADAIMATIRASYEELTSSQASAASPVDPRYEVTADDLCIDDDTDGDQG